jgi:hypothetical protein
MQTQLFPIFSSAVSNMKNNKFFSGILIAVAAISGVAAQASTASAQIASSSTVWNSAQPTIFSGASQGFDHKPFQQFVQTEGVELKNSGQKKVDISNLFLKYDHNVKVSFINEGAGYRNQLAFTSTAVRPSGTTKQGLLFKDIACSGTYDGGKCQGDWGGNTLKFGDTVSTGMIKGGSQLDFFLRADGMRRGTSAYTFGTQNAQNEDGLQHVVAYTYGSRYLLMGFEDLYGLRDGKAEGKFNENSDRDFNDTIFVVDIGEANVACLNAGDACTKAPEPAAAAGLVGLGLTAAVVGYRRRRG